MAHNQSNYSIVTGTKNKCPNAGENIFNLTLCYETSAVFSCMGANVYDILKRDTLVLTKAGVEALEARLK